MNFSKIKKLNYKDYRLAMVYRLLKDDIVNLPKGEQWVISDNPLRLHKQLKKPDEKLIKAEFKKYKKDLENIQRSRILEEEKRAELHAQLTEILNIDCSVLFLNYLEDRDDAVDYLYSLIETDKKKLEGYIEDFRKIISEAKIIKEKKEVLDEIVIIKNRAKMYLRETDFSQLADVPLNSQQKAQYREYRDYLRNIDKIYNNKQILKPVVMDYDTWKFNKPVY